MSYTANTRSQRTLKPTEKMRELLVEREVSSQKSLARAKRAQLRKRQAWEEANDFQDVDTSGDLSYESEEVDLPSDHAQFVLRDPFLRDSDRVPDPPACNGTNRRANTQLNESNHRQLLPRSSHIPKPTEDQHSVSQKNPAKPQREASQRSTPLFLESSPSPSPSSPHPARASFSHPQNCSSHHGNTETQPVPSTPRRRSHSEIRGSPSPTGSSKRRRAEPDDQRKRLRAGSMKSIIRALLKIAIGHYRCMVSTKNPYPDVAEEQEWAAECWTLACRQKGVSIEIDEDIITLITARSSHVRGELKTKARPLVAALYEMVASSKRDDVIQNRERVQALLFHDAFMYSNPSTHSGLLQHPSIQAIINEMWFADSRDEGIVYGKYFKPSLSLVTMALVLTVIMNVLEEWQTGTPEKIDFSEKNYRQKYERVFRKLQDFDARTQQYRIIPTVLKNVLLRARDHARAPEDTEIEESFFADDEVEAAIREWSAQVPQEGVTDGEVSQNEE